MTRATRALPASPSLSERSPQPARSAPSPAHAEVRGPSRTAPPGSLIGDLRRSDGEDGGVHDCPVSEEHDRAGERGSR
ncbi:hypothetical protein Ppa06_67190 [Planomonospora parontospora subsp. parontospora]|uniref:Uncharacterized protein n=2 Tax=Planomonospora parontospora TaxID=58119 RepID=A0AA37BNP5_9ACTN|nr:hypothetical protein [Planomonospora parontospora]GGK98933.1 hypothetical protein GCM10010126_67890 [Planomonospora parontospora]GII12921.1 hypothetical protein Ppa06_67190 [Planomonospora parontospora subsp. parontospora]